MNKILLLTYDYELFLKKPGLLLSELLEPTNRILDISNYFGIKSTFFVDAAYLLRVKMTSKGDFKLITNQLIKIIESGHRIELHLHPHWLDSNFINNEWTFENYDRFRLHSLSDLVLNDLIQDSIQLLNSQCRQVDSNYKVEIFRAGGWCIQPSKKITDILKKNNILIDSSICPQLSSSNLTHYFDFTKINKLKPYRFDDNVEHEVNTGIFWEMPISTFKVDFQDKLLFKIYKIIFKEEFMRSSYGEGFNINNRLNFLSKFKSHYDIASLDFLSGFTLNKIINKNTNNYLCFASHPKLMTNYSFKLIEKLAVKESISFMTMKDYKDNFLI